MGLAIVTGGSRGIGAEISRELGRLGFTVGVNYSSNSAKADEVVTEIKAAGGQAVAFGMNVGDSADVDEKLGALAKEHGGVEVLVNNAGITIDGLLMRLKDEDLDKTLQVDLKGAIYCTRAVTRYMMKAKKGAIINISSVVGESGNAGQAAYAAAKAGLIGFSKAAAKELASRGIRVNCITPGFIETDMTGALNEDQQKAIADSIPMGRFGKPQDIAELVGFLAHRGTYVTGQVIGVNGGMYM